MRNRRGRAEALFLKFPSRRGASCEAPCSHWVLFFFLLPEHVGFYSNNLRLYCLLTGLWLSFMKGVLNPRNNVRGAVLMTGSTIPPRRSRAKIVADSVILSHNSIIRARHCVELVAISNVLRLIGYLDLSQKGLVRRSQLLPTTSRRTHHACSHEESRQIYTHDSMPAVVCR